MENGDQNVPGTPGRQDTAPFVLLGNGENARETRKYVSAACDVDESLVDDAYPCTPSQLSAISQPKMQSLRATMELSPDVCTESFRHAWEQVVDELGVLRTRIVYHSTFGYVQVLIRQSINWDKDEISERSLGEFGRPLARYTIVEREGQKRQFIWTFHQALFDHRFAKLTLSRVLSVFKGLDLPQLYPFKTYVNQTLDQDGDAARRYWASYLSGYSVAAHRQVKSKPAAEKAEVFTCRRTCSIRQTASGSDLELFIYAGFAILMSSMTESADVTFGVLEGEAVPDNLAGPSATIVPVRATIDQRMTVPEFLSRIMSERRKRMLIKQMGLNQIRCINGHTSEACRFESLLVAEPLENAWERDTLLGKWAPPTPVYGVNEGYMMTVHATYANGQVNLAAYCDGARTTTADAENMTQWLSVVIFQVASARHNQTIGELDTLSLENIERPWTRNRVVQSAAPPAAADLNLHQTQISTPTGEVANGVIQSIAEEDDQQEDNSDIQQRIASACNLSPQSIEDAYPCTPLQEGLLALTAKHRHAYTMRSMQELSNDIDQHRFKTAWQTASRRLPILRTRIIQDNEFGLLQVVVDEDVRWFVGDSLNRYLEEDRVKPIGLSHPLVRYALIQDRETCATWFVWTIHHALYDGHFIGRLFELVRCLYEGLPEPAFKDFKYFVQYLGANNFEVSADYWESALSGYASDPFPPKLTTGRPAGKCTTERRIDLPPISESDMTVASLVKAAWSLTVALCSDTRDIVIGTTVSGRHARMAGIEEIAGPTIATVPVRVRMTPSQSIGQYLRAVQEQWAEMIPHEQMGLQYIQNLSDDAHRACQFQTLLVIQPPEEASADTSATLGQGRIDSAAGAFATYGLNLTMVMRNGTLTVSAVFDTARLSQESASMILERFDRVLRQLVSSRGHQTISEVDVLSSTDYEKLWSWNGTVPATVERCVHHLVEEQAAARPDAMAVCAWDGDLTYGKLDGLSSRLALDLVELGVGPGVLVPLCFEKSVWTVVAMLAVLKAGGAFVPLDPSQGADRRERVIEQADAKVVLASVGKAKMVVRLGRVVVVVGPGSIGEARLEVPEGWTAQGTPATPAYVLFTSGSTGQPKGVVIEHRALASSCFYHGQRIGFSERGRVLQFTSYAFDVSMMEIFTTLLHGGCICVPSDQHRLGDVGRAASEMRVDTAFLTPSVARTIDPAGFQTLDTLILGGEKVTEGDMARWSHLGELVDGYGPTEATIFCSVNVTGKDDRLSGGIGHAVGCVLWVVQADDHTKLMPIGSVGELLVEGPILSRGYLKDAERTAAAFIEDPPWLVRGAPGRPGRRGRLYKTGDLVRYNEDGSLAFVGRKDSQVKIRGQRVELGEVEHHVLACVKGARQVAAEVITPAGDGASAMLAAFVVSGESERSDEKEVLAKVTKISAAEEDALAERLPVYMMPAIYFSVTKIPINTAGKTDRRRLRDIGAGFSAQELADLRSGPRTAKRAPSTQAERALQQIWARVLNIDAEAIGVDDSFFRLGGDSIAAMKLVAQARHDGLTISVADVFRYPRLMALSLIALPAVGEPSEEPHTFSMIPAIAVEGLSHALTIQERMAAACGLRPDSIEDAYPCTPLQEGLLALTSKSLGAYTMRSIQELARDIDLDRFRAAWEAAVRRLAILRTRVVQDELFGLLQVVVDEQIRWREVSDLHEYLMQDSEQPMELGQPLARYALITEKDEPTCVRFVWTVHHALYDGHLIGRIHELVTCIYHGSGAEPVLRDFKYFVQYLETAKSEAAADYWRSTLAGYESEPFPLPGLAATGPAANDTVEKRIELPPMSEPDVTIGSLMRAAWALTVAACSGSTDVVIGTTVSGRQASLPGVEDIAGPTIATVPVRINAGVSQTVHEYLRTVQEQSIRMIPYEQTGLQRIREMSEEGRRACQFQTLLVVQPRVEADAEADSEAPADVGVWSTNTEAEAFSSYALNITVNVEEGGALASVVFDTGRISNWAATLLIDRFGYVAQQLASASAEQMVGEVDLLAAAEYKQLWSWNETVPATVDRCVHDLVREQAAARPGAAAVCAWDGDLTYRELDDLSSRLACHLVEHGVGPEMLVPLCFEKSRWTVVAMLAVLKAGGAFVLLDASQPVARRQAIVAQTKAQLLICSVAQGATCSTLATRTITVGPHSISSPVETGKADSYMFQRQVDPSSPMYIVFTSGSTGQAKGVVISHAAMSSAISYQASAMAYSSSVRALDFSSYAFDMSIESTFFALASGGCVCVPSDVQRMDDLTGSVQTLKANHMTLTPSVSRMIDRNRVSHVKSLILGGEEATRKDLEGWPDSMRVINTYGPAECTPVSTVAEKKVPNLGIGIGAGSVTWVVNTADYRRLAPIGAVGELLLEGPIVGQGYLHDAEKTAAVFIDNPPWLVQGAAGRPGRRGRLYKTGDWVRYNEDGSLMFVGRKDSQVKIRGQRVELGEVEHQVLACVKGAQQAAAEVIIPGADDASALLAAFVVLEEADEDQVPARVISISAEDEDALAEHLPAYMLPAVYFAVVQLPMNKSGKTDRRRLREIGASFSSQQLAELRSGPRGEKKAPSTEAELTLQQIWASVLNIKANTIGVDDSFFRLGGDSIAAMKLVAQARHKGLKLSVADVFRNSRLKVLSCLALPAAEEPIDEVAPFCLIGPHAVQGDSHALMIQERVATACGLQPGCIQDAYPCTPLQEGLLALTSKSLGAYTMRSIQELARDIDLDRFRAAWEAAVRRLAILRTRVVQDELFGLLQVVVDEQIRWREVSDLHEYLMQDSEQPMELGQPLARYALITEKDEPTCVRFVWTVHHALYDGHLIGRIHELVTCIYHGSGAEPVLRDFKYFVQYLETAKSEAAADYWRSTLAGYESEPFPLPGLAATGPAANDTVEKRIELPPMSEPDVTIGSLMRAAWALTVAACSGSTDVVIGTTVSGRQASLPGVEDIAGPTIATVPVRINAGVSQTVHEYLRTVQEQSIRMIPYEQTGLQRIREMSEEGRRACQFQTLLVVQPRVEADAEADSEAPADVGVWSTNTEAEAFSSYALNITVNVEEGGALASVVFDTGRISNWAATLLIDRFGYVAQQLASASAEQMVGEVDLLAAAEYKQLWSWNETVPATVDRCVHDLVREQAAARPGAAAVCAWDGDLTYRELDDLSSRLACHLVEHGVGPEMLVPLCFEKSRWTVVAMLAVLKAGGAFVHLDVSLPPVRAHSIVRHCDAKLLLCSPSQCVRCSTLSVKIITVDSALYDLGTADVSSTQMTGRAIASSLMYAVFTSGSTGRPKGVLITHTAFSSATFYQAPPMGYSTDTRTFDFASYAFDTSIETALMTLITGGCLCVPSEADRKDDLVGSLLSTGATLVELTPSVARSIDRKSLCSKGLTIVLGGESVLEADFHGWPENVRVINTYGPSECTPTSTINTSGTYDIGSGKGVLTWVADMTDYNRLVPIGSVGELLLEGPTVGRGYLKEPEKTAASFIEDPAWLLHGWAGRKGRHGRLHKTGDLVRYNEDGSLVFIGRKDSQVKVRGQRVELGEVEHHVEMCIRGVRQVAAEVITPRGEGARAMLAVFMVLGEVDDAGDEELSARLMSVSVEDEDELAQRVPVYMVPAVYVSVTRMPMNTSGKTDRRRLREIGAGFSSQQLAELRIGPHATKRAPSTEAERVLQQIWSRVLNIEPDDIGMDDSFFRLGGDSITAMQVSALARDVLGNISTTDIFTKKTISQLLQLPNSGHGPPSSTVEHTASGNPCVFGAENGLRSHLLSSLSLSEDDVEDIFPCTPVQENILLAQSLDPRTYRTSLALEFVGTSGMSLDLRRIDIAWRAVMQRHGLLRSLLVPGALQSGRTLHIVLKQPEPNITFHHGEYEQSSLELRDLNLSLQHHVSIYQTEQGRAYFHLDMNHAIIDGHSCEILIHDFALAYSTGKLGLDKLLFRTHVAYVDSQPRSVSNQFWSKYLSPVRPCQFPTSGERRSVETTFQIQVQGLRSEKIRLFCRQWDWTIATVVQVAWSLVLAHYTRSTSPCFWTITSGRDIPIGRVHDILGPFMCLVPCQVRLDQNDTVRHVLEETKQHYLRSLPHQANSLPVLRPFLSRGANELFNTAVSFYSVTNGRFREADSASMIPKEGKDPVEYDIYIRATDDGLDLGVTLEFWHGQFSHSEGSKVAEALCHAIYWVILNPDDEARLWRSAWVG